MSNNKESLKERIAVAEISIITSTIIDSGFELTAAANKLCISRATLYRKLGNSGLKQVNQLRKQALAQAGAQIVDANASI